MSNLKSGSNLEKVLKAGHFAFTGECGPPKGANVEHLRKKIEPLKGMVDAVNVTDNQTAVVRMSSWAASTIMCQEGVEPNFQMVCRDRNRLAIQSDILGVYAMRWTPATPSISLNSSICSKANRIPSSATFPFPAPLNLLIRDSGTSMPGTCLAI